MSSPIWTPAALSSECHSYQALCWRLVEAQHRYSTLKLTDGNAEQALLEELIEESKPAIPAECRHLHFLLATPFRYGADYPRGSRFRRAGRTLGVFYAAEQVTTAVAEMAFYRLLFFSESPDTPWPANASEYTAFSAGLKPAVLSISRARHSRRILHCGCSAKTTVTVRPWPMPPALQERKSSAINRCVIRRRVAMSLSLSARPLPSASPCKPRRGAST